MTDALRWYHDRQTLPGYAELTAAHEALNFAAADAELEPDAEVAIRGVTLAVDRWVDAYRAWHQHTGGRMPA